MVQSPIDEQHNGKECPKDVTVKKHLPTIEFRVPQSPAADNLFPCFGLGTSTLGSSGFAGSTILISGMLTVGFTALDWDRVLRFGRKPVLADKCVPKPDRGDEIAAVSKSEAGTQQRNWLQFWIQ